MGPNGGRTASIHYGAGMPSLSPRAQQTRALLIEQGIRAFGELGHDRVNLVADILQPAGVNPGSFYHQFSDKTDLLLAILDEAGTRRAATMLAPMDGGSVEEIVGTIIGRVFESMDDQDHLWTIQSRERSSAEPRIRQRILRSRMEWIDGITALIVAYADMGEDDARQAAEMIVVFGLGLVSLYLGLSPDERAARRDRLHTAATHFVTAGATAMVLTDSTSSFATS